IILITSGCVRETGDIVINFTDLNISEQEAGINLSELEELPEAPEAEEEPEETAPEEPEAAENVTAEEIDLCASVVCDDSITTCPDGTVMTCGNTCDPETGNCTTCIPDCTGHEAPEECELECGTCEFLDEEACECIIILSCDGNGICEGSEWPDGEDCLPFEGCDDEDDCTLDIFNFNYQSCSHVDICCDDSDDCTLDEYNYTTQECQHTYICCGNDICEPENGETEENCPEDCFEEELGDVEITHISPLGDEEMVTLEGYAIDMTDWTIEDSHPEAPNHIYSFPEGFVINGIVYLHTQGSFEDNNETDLYWTNKTIYIWNDDHDNATLRNETGGVVSFYEY
ncbi:MAG: lamin tail domain-containing protein, partial [Candidatus Aenigmarchaeota archaeon]|nr:lamin tail domain-containing protein [Candidatus Aenigmarchaeota archaeon]